MRKESLCLKVKTGNLFGPEKKKKTTLKDLSSTFPSELLFCPLNWERLQL